MAWSGEASRMSANGLPTPPILMEWNQDEAQRQIAQQAQEIRALKETIRALQETIRGSTRLAVELQRTLMKKDRRIRELESTVRFLEDRLIQFHRVLRPLS